MSQPTEKTPVLPRPPPPAGKTTPAGSCCRTACCYLVAAVLGAVVVATIAVSAVVHSGEVNDAFDRLLDRFQEGKEYNAANHYLLGNFAPVSDEVSGLDLKVVSGSIPDGMTGVFLRNGPNPIREHGHTKRYHWFDGHGYIHSLRLDSQSQSATYSSAWIQTGRYKYERAIGRDFFIGLGEFIGLTGLLKVLLVFPSKLASARLHPLRAGQANTALVTHADRVFSLHEGSFPFEIRMRRDGSFQSIGHEDFGRQLDFPMSAHPKPDPVTGELVFHGYRPNEPEAYKWGSLAPNGTLVNSAGVRTADGRVSLAHDFAITEAYAILLDTSVRFAPGKLVEGKAFDMDGEYPMKFGLAPRGSSSGEDVRWFELDYPLAVMHTFNAWDYVDNAGNKKVVLWGCGATDFDMIDIEGKNKLFHPYSFVFDLADGSVRATRIPVPPHLDGTTSFEFPNVHPELMGRHTDYGFSGHSPVGDGRFKGIAKWGMGEGGSGELVTVVNFSEKFDDTTYSGEPVFVPKPRAPRREKRGRGEGGGGEPPKADAGWLMVVLYQGSTAETFVAAYDGETMSGEPVMVASAPRIPYGFHGSWIPEATLRRHVEMWEAADRDRITEYRTHGSCAA